MIIYYKASYYLTLFDDLAPLMDIMVKIAIDIRYFVVILLIYGFGFSCCFYLIGRNQVNFDLQEMMQELNDPNLSDAARNELEDDLEKVNYNTLSGAMWYIFYGFILGNSDAEGFELGDGS